MGYCNFVPCVFLQRIRGSRWTCHGLPPAPTPPHTLALIMQLIVWPDYASTFWLENSREVTFIGLFSFILYILCFFPSYIPFYLSTFRSLFLVGLFFSYFLVDVTLLTPLAQEKLVLSALHFTPLSARHSLPQSLPQLVTVVTFVLVPCLPL